MKIVWSNGAKKAFSRIDERYQRRIEVSLPNWMTARHPGPISKKYRRQKIISGYALAITASSIRFGTIPITIVIF